MDNEIRKRRLNRQYYIDLGKQYDFDFLDTDIEEEKLHCSLSYRWKCKNNHIFKRTSKYIRDGKGCKFCNKPILKNKRKDSRNLDKLNNVLKTEEYGLIKWEDFNNEYVNSYKALADKRKFELIFVAPTKKKEISIWKCQNGHIIKRAYDLIKNCKGCACYLCDKHKPKNESDYLQLAKQREANFIGPIPQTTEEKCLWKCKCGEEISTSYNYVQNGGGKLRCYRCLKIERSPSKKRATKQDYISLTTELNGTFIGPLPNSAKKRTGWLCSCGERVERTFCYLKRYKMLKCSKCKNKKDAVRITEEDYLKIADKFNGEFVGPFPKSSDTRTFWKCPCSNKFESSYSNIKFNRKHLLCEDCRRIETLRNQYPRNEMYKNDSNKKRRRSNLMLVWSKSVYENYNFKCFKCNSGKYIVAHHIFNYDNYSELRINIDNGVCLCEQCHFKFHSEYGNKFCTIDKLLTYIPKKQNEIDLIREKLYLSFDPQI